MRFGNFRPSARTVALLTATVMLFTGGGYMTTRAALTYYSQDYTAGFELDHLQVHLLENDEDVCDGKNNMSTVHRADDASDTDVKQAKVAGQLAAYLKGKAEPGRKYEEKISAQNGSTIDQYVRMVIRKYWLDQDGEKATALSPDLIKLTYRDKDYNDGAWTLNAKESTAESETYYLNRVLEANEPTEALFDTLYIDKSVADLANRKTTTKTTQDGTVKVTEYTYDYNGFSFCIEAEVQAIQTHNADGAIGSVWGVDNVTASDGIVTVK